MPDAVDDDTAPSICAGVSSYPEIGEYTYRSGGGEEIQSMHRVDVRQYRSKLLAG